MCCGTSGPKNSTCDFNSPLHSLRPIFPLTNITCRDALRPKNWIWDLYLKWLRQWSNCNWQHLDTKDYAVSWPFKEKRLISQHQNYSVVCSALWTCPDASQFAEHGPHSPNVLSKVTQTRELFTYSSHICALIGWLRNNQRLDPQRRKSFEGSDK